MSISKFQSNLVEFAYREPFWGRLFRNMPKKQVQGKDFPTIAVGYNDGKITLFYNLEFMDSLSLDSCVEVFKHEIMHVVGGHLWSRSLAQKGNKAEQKIANIAQDLAINSQLDEKKLPDFVYMPGKKFKPLDQETIEKIGPERAEAIEKFHKLIESMVKGECAEHYWSIIMNSEEGKAMKEIYQKSEGMKIKIGKGSGQNGEVTEEDLEKAIDEAIGQLDDHGYGDDMTDEEKRVARDQLKKQVKEAMDHCHYSGSWGSVSSEMKQQLKKFISKEINWKNQLLHFTRSVRSSSSRSSIKKINKRYPYMHPGRKREHRTRLLVAIDSSGSVSNKEMEYFYATICSLSSHADIDIVLFDTEVDENSMQRVKKGQKFKCVRSLVGGTDFNAPTRWINERMKEYDGLAIFSDGECCEPDRCRKPRIWIVPEQRGLLFETKEKVLKMKMDSGKSSI